MLGNTKLLFIMDNIFELRKLSQTFYDTYSCLKYPEMEHKAGRPYIVLLVKINELIFAIPFRTNIRHNYCYKFSNSNRKSNSVTGIDFSKAVVITNDMYLGEITNIDDKEYLELNNKAYFVINKFKKYVNDYICYKKNGGNEYIEKRYKYSTLIYFDDILLK